MDYDYNVHAKTRQKYKPSIGAKTSVTMGDYASLGVKMVTYQDWTYVGKHISPVTTTSDDSNKASFIKLTGDCLTGQTQNWEDGGDGDFKDFVFKLTCTSDGASGGDVRLVE